MILADEYPTILAGRRAYARANSPMYPHEAIDFQGRRSVAPIAMTDVGLSRTGLE
jgi:hypothetical protein